MYDLLITGGTLIDGTGAPRRTADVAVADGRVAALGRLAGAAARRTIDADGLVVMPGVFDAHTHYDAQLMWDPWATSSCLHGVTTVLTGNCGYTLAPVRAEDRDYMVELFSAVEGVSAAALRQGLSWRWESYAEFLAALGEAPGVNVVPFVGHTALRRYAMGEAASERAATEDEIARMQALVAGALAAGAAGLSSSRSPNHVDGVGRPVPSRAAADRELVALAGALAKAGRGYVGFAPGTATRGLDPEERQLIRDVAGAARRPVLANGFTQLLMARDPAAPAAALRETLADFRAAGADVYAYIPARPIDQFFTLADARTGVLERWLGWPSQREQDTAARRAALADPDFRAELATAGADAQWDRVVVLKTRLPAHAGYEGASVAYLAATAGRLPLDFFLDLALSEDLATQFYFAGLSPTGEPAIAELLRDPNVIVGTSDGGAHLHVTDGADYSTYFLKRWVLDRGLIPLEEGVRRLTGGPAALLGLADRGVVREGAAADLAIFDPERLDPGLKEPLNDFPGGETRYLVRPRGFTHTIVNGRIIVEQGELTGERPGRVLSPLP
jgi:N-acyl-D-aspartate/D-glutamate deacylase